MAKKSEISDVDDKGVSHEENWRQLPYVEVSDDNLRRMLGNSEVNVKYRKNYQASDGIAEALEQIRLRNERMVDDVRRARDRVLHSLNESNDRKDELKARMKRRTRDRAMHPPTVF